MLSNRWFDLTQTTESPDAASQATEASMLSGQGRPESSRPADLSTSPPELAPEVRCSDCRHGQPATSSDPWSWHLCAAGAIRAHGWGMAARRCERWEGKS